MNYEYVSEEPDLIFDGKFCHIYIWLEKRNISVIKFDYANNVPGDLRFGRNDFQGNTNNYWINQFKRIYGWYINENSLNAVKELVNTYNLMLKDEIYGKWW